MRLAFSPGDGRYLVSAGKDGKLRIWDGTSLDQHQISPREMALSGGEIADTLAFNAQGTRLAVRSRDLTVSICDVATGTNVLTLRDSAHGFNALAFSPDPEGRWLASGGLDSTVKVWDARTGITAHFQGHQDREAAQFVRLPKGTWSRAVRTRR
jgi:WD40 repeat protein